MIEDPPLLTLRRNFGRPDPLTLSDWGQHQPPFWWTVWKGAVHWIFESRLFRDCRIPPTGVALPCQNGPDDNLGLLGAVHIAQPGDFIIAGTESFTKAAVTGDLVLGMARNRGVTGFATDGLIRDLPGCRKVGLPTFAAGISPNSPVRNGPGSAGLPINLGSVHVQPGDVVVADEDGVVIVPQQKIKAVIERLAAIEEKEAEMDKLVMEGGLDDPPYIAALIESGDVRFINE